MAGRKRTGSTIAQDPANANVGTARGRKALRESLHRNGVGRSILIDKHGVIIAGNKTAEAAALEGITEIEIVQSDGTKIIAVQRTDLDLATDKIAKELAVADNRVAEIGLEWDPRIIGTLSMDLDLSPYFTDDELKEMAITDVDPITEEDAEIASTPEPITQVGDMYSLGSHRLLCGDSTNPIDVDRLIGGERVGLVFTDPPYGISVEMNNTSGVAAEKIMGDDSTEVAAAAFRHCSALGVPMVFWGANHYASDAHLPNASCWITWDKQEANNHIDQADCELAWTNLRGPARVFHHLWAGFRRDSEQGELRVHPTQKPVALIVEILEFFRVDKIVLDLFGGSGSTLLACESTRREALIMELDPKYCDVIVARWEKATGKKAVLHGRP